MGATAVTLIKPVVVLRLKPAGIAGETEKPLAKLLAKSWMLLATLSEKAKLLPVVWLVIIGNPAGFTVCVSNAETPGTLLPSPL